MANALFGQDGDQFGQGQGQELDNKSAMNFLGLFRSSIKELNINVAHAEDYLEDWTAIRFFAAPTCANLTTCVDCVTSPGCRWCQLANKCTDKNTRDDDWTVR